MYQYIYASDAQEGLTRSNVSDIVAASERNNAKVNVTGILLWTGTAFIQLLEGPMESVQAITARIATDPRHTNIIEISAKDLPSRLFPNWGMQGVANLTGITAELLMEALGDEPAEADKLVAQLAGVQFSDELMLNDAAQC